MRQTIEMFEVITESQPQDVQSLEILKEAYSKLGREPETLRTAKRIAEAYRQLGQLTSAIMELETILQSHPDDPDAKKTLADIENKASNFAAPAAPVELPPPPKPEPVTAAKATPARGEPVPILDDGRQAMFKVFVESKFITAGDFDLCWVNPPLNAPPGKVIDPFLQVLADKKIKDLDASLKLLCEKARMAYMPLEKYDIDIEVARSFPKDSCQRWCVLPFDKMSKSIMVATANPFNQQAAKELTDATKGRLIWYVASPQDMLKALKKVFR